MVRFDPDPVPARSPAARKAAVYLLCGVGLLVVYALTATLLWINRDFAQDGPLGYRAPRATAALEPTTSLATVQRQCVDVGNFSVDRQDTVKIVAARVGSTAYYACYHIVDGKVFAAVVIDGDGLKAPDRIAKQLGAWRWIGVVKTPGELVLGGGALAVLLGVYFMYYRRARPGPPDPARWWQTSPASALLGALIVLPFTLPFRRGESRARRIRLLYLFGFGWTTFIIGVLLITSLSDRMSAVVFGLLTAGLVFGWRGGRSLLLPPGFGVRDQVGERRANASPPGANPVGAPDQIGGRWGASQIGGASDAGQVDKPATPAKPSNTRRAPVAGRASYIRSPSGLPNFADVGGMQTLKAEVSDTFGLLLAFGAEADTYRIAFNGVLLHGPPGVGKTFIAKAIAGEFGLHLAHVSTGDLVSKYVGESAANIRAVFNEAARHVPCLLFFDEFDSIAERRDSGLSEESRRVVNQLLQSLEEWRPVRDLVIVAATNHLDHLDPAAVRSGRFDRHIRVDLPDLETRRAILAAQLDRRPQAPDIDLDDLAERTAGRTPATITRVVEAAALSAFRVATESGTPAPINHLDLRTALAGLGGSDRPTIENWNWDRLILPDRMKAELKQIQALVADPDLAKAYGVEVPSGLLLAGPPGTGKTTIARVLAAQTGFSFYSQTAADLTSMWVGESEASVVRLFARARENAPSVIFIDEIDSIAGTRSDSGSSYLDRTLTQLLTEIDGLVQQPGVFVVAATNRPDMLDPALLRGGRLSRTITIPLPDVGDRRRLLTIFTRQMPLQNVDLDKLAGETVGYSGADLEALCQQAAVNSMLEAKRSEAEGPSVVTAAAFAEALRDRARAADLRATGSDERRGRGGYL